MKASHLGVDDLGRLVIQTESGQKLVNAGDVSLRSTEA